MTKFCIFLVICMACLTSCSSDPPTPAGNQPHLNGMPVLAIYYDDMEEPAGYGKYHAFLFILPNDQFVMWRNRDEVQYILSNLVKLEAEYPSTKNPIKFTRSGNSISGIKTFDYSNNENFRPHIVYQKYYGEFKDNVLNLRSSSRRVYPDGREENDYPDAREENNFEILWNFRKLREY